MENETSILQGQVAIVTGGGRGIGQAIAQALATAGAKVAVAARSADQLAQAVEKIVQSDGHALALPVDVTDLPAVKQMVAQVEEELGPVDILVNNAGYGGRPGPVRETDAEAWWQVMAVNLQGPFLCAQAVLAGMTSRRRGRIINVSSIVGQMGVPGTVAYSASKAGLLGLTRTLAAENATKNITVNALALGYFEVGMINVIKPEVQDQIRAKIPMKRLGHPRNVELAIRFLIESDYVTGAVININGGLL